MMAIHFNLADGLACLVFTCWMIDRSETLTIIYKPYSISIGTFAVLAMAAIIFFSSFQLTQTN